MKELRLNLENCYGIKRMQHTIDFSTDNIAIIYAPNGTMKTSFADTFRAISEDKAPYDRVYALPTVCDIKNENNNPIDKNNILVINKEEIGGLYKYGRKYIS